jgi:anti-sigma-K factor RskA
VSTKHTTPDRRDCGLDAAAYVLGALEKDELETFRAHLSGCAACREEVAALQHVADALPGAAPAIAPPQDLRRRVMDAVRHEQKGAASATLADRPPWWHRRLPFPKRRPAVVLGGALAAAVAIVVAVVLASGGSSATRVIQADVRGAGAAELILTGGRGELVVSHFPSPGTGRIYQVWLRRPHGPPLPTRTLFGVTTGGGGAVGVAGDLHGVSEVLVTSEPAGGSSVPTTAPVITAQL